MMSVAAVFVFCLLQAQATGPSPDVRMAHEILEWQMTHQAAAGAESSTAIRQADYEQREFANKFNRLLDTLREFADEYNRHVVDVKKVKALKKAWRDLEKTDGWFKLDEHSGH